MISKVDSKETNMLQSSFWGIVRGISVEVFIYPLEVVKIRQQCSTESEKSICVARRVFKQEGFKAFFKGLSPQLFKTSLKQFWCWPMIAGIPRSLQSMGIGDVQQQICTGVSIATVDAVISTPLERAKIYSAFTGKKALSFTGIYKDGWHGFTAYWIKRSINMTTFLLAQKHLREYYRTGSEPLSFAVMTKVGFQVALIVSLISAPFDTANTVKQAQNKSLFQLFSKQSAFRLYRGWPLNAVSLVVHNVASVIVIEKLGL